MARAASAAHFGVDWLRKAQMWFWATECGAAEAPL